ncbi:4679_t:CDS:1 [Dentiscutata erythropus]|uniref:4679_t:CDS:1 n=1 Tax=Dentiscutata erythropus TaxID=1348616 RepID=A0A9N9NM89_9GLOM|nr:4679_t:CDS:1 [Dentiscutata erythropus]
MSFLCQRQNRRGPYATKACVNCRQRHIRCSGNVPCNHCTQRSVECVFINSGKKRGPKTSQSSVIPEVQGYASSSPQQLDNYGDISFYFIPYDALQIDISEELVPLLNQANYYVMQDLTSNLHRNNISLNNNNIYLNNHTTISSNLDYLHSE